MYYISDIYNSMTQEHVKSLVTVVSDESYWVELRDCETNEQVVVCKPSIVFEDRYKKHVIGIVTAYTIQVINRSFLNLLSYIDVKYLKSSEICNIPKNAIMIDIGLNVRNSNGLWYSPATPLQRGAKQKYLSLFEVLVKLQNQHQDLNIYGVGVKYLRARLGGIIKVTVKKDLTLPITKYMIRK